MRQETNRTLLLIDADQAQRHTVASVASRAGWRVEAMQRAKAMTTLSKNTEVTALLLAKWDRKLIEEIRSITPRLPILAFADALSSIEAVRAGVTDTLSTPIRADRLIAALDMARDRRARNGELRPLTEKISKPLTFEELVGSTPAFLTALAIAAKAARSRIPVLIEGERGSGKETIAHAIHASGPRGNNKMVVFDCGAINPSLIEFHLFGYEKGAFPGAFDRRTGVLENADGTTLFLDQIDKLPIDIQFRILHVVETGEVERIGGRGFKSVDLRIIAASSQPLARKVEESCFREDLYRSIAMVTISIPPLRERTEDIPALARHFLAFAAKQPGMRMLGIADDALALLMSFGWPGNVRQLQDALFRAAIFCNGQTLAATDFPQITREITCHRRADDYHVASQNNQARSNISGVTLYQSDGNLRPLEEIEADIIRLAIRHYHGRMVKVAHHLHIGRSTLYRKLAELGISDAA